VTKRKPRFTVEKKTVVQIRYYETMYLIHDGNGERIFAGSEESAKRVLKLLNAQRGSK